MSTMIFGSLRFFPYGVRRVRRKLNPPLIDVTEHHQLIAHFQDEDITDANYISFTKTTSNIFFTQLIQIK